MTARLEHAKVSVHDMDGILRFLQTALPQFRVRHDAMSPQGERWVHIGTDDHYLALSQAPSSGMSSGSGDAGQSRLNHLAFEVDDVDEVRRRLQDAGFEESGAAEAHPFRTRVYFVDPDGQEWEFVQYFTDDRRQRHDYELPDVYVPAGDGRP